MNTSLLGAAALALAIATPASAQLLGGGGGIGGLGGSVGGTLGSTIERGRTGVDTTVRSRASTRIDHDLRPRSDTRAVSTAAAGMQLLTPTCVSASGA